MTDSIIVFGRVCPSIGRAQEAYSYGDRVILIRSNSEKMQMLYGGKFLAHIFAEPLDKNKTSHQRSLAYAGGASYEDAIHALAARLHQLAVELVKEPPAL